MKGVILLALKGMVQQNYGGDQWAAALRQAGVEEHLWIMPISNVDDRLVLQIINSLCESLGLSFEQVAEAFGEYWVNVYTQKRYASYYVGARTAKQFLLRMDEIHTSSTKSMPDALPPQFDYRWKDEHTMVMTYRSHRGMIDLMIGMIKGVARLYHEKLIVTKMGDDQAEIVFPRRPQGKP